MKRGVREALLRIYPGIALAGKFAKVVRRWTITLVKLQTIYPHEFKVMCRPKT